MNRRMLLIGALLSAGCSAPTDAPDRNREQTALNAPHQVLVREGYSGLPSSERLIIRSQSELDELWTAVYAYQSPRPATPAVDFDTYTVVAAAMGARPHGGYGIDITSVAVSGNQAVVTVEERSPGSTCGTTQAITAPVVLARIARTDHVRFEETAYVHECD